MRLGRLVDRSLPVALGSHVAHDFLLDLERLTMLLFLICAEPISAVAPAYAPPVRDTNSASDATTIAGEGLRNFLMPLPFPRRMLCVNNRNLHYGNPGQRYYLSVYAGPGH